MSRPLKTMYQNAMYRRYSQEFSKISELPYLTFKLKEEKKTCPLPLSVKISSASLIFSVTFLLLSPARLPTIEF